jgi:hypothetical protein
MVDMKIPPPAAHECGGAKLLDRGGFVQKKRARPLGPLAAVHIYPVLRR